MNLVLGANGHVGSAVARTLLEAGEPVTVALHDAANGAAWQERGARVVVVDIRDVDALRRAFRAATRAFLLNPPADPSTDTDAAERATVRCLLAALEGCGLEKLVAESTMGAQPGEAIGDLSVLYELEQGLQRQPVPFGVIRAAYYMSNWDSLLDAVREHGVLQTMLPADLQIPMVAPDDLGRAAASFLTAPPDVTGMRSVEGPARYSPRDVAEAFAAALHKPVTVQVTPRDQWEQAFRALGFSAPAARSYSRMTAVSVDAGFEPGPGTTRGTTSLRDYIQRLVERPPDAR